MTAARRTLEEIEALAAEATPGPWEFSAGSDVECDSVIGPPRNGVPWRFTICCNERYYPTAVGEKDQRLIAEVWTLLAIAQGQREELERLRRYANILHEAIPELTDEMVDNACGPALDPVPGPDAISYGMRMTRRAGYRDGWVNCAHRLKQTIEIENPYRHQKVST